MPRDAGRGVHAVRAAAARETGVPRRLPDLGSGDGGVRGGQRRDGRVRRHGPALALRTPQSNLKPPARLSAVGLAR